VLHSKEQLDKMLVLQDVSIKVEDKELLNNVNLEFGPGIHFIVGPNGAGKSTLAHAIMANPKYNTSGSIVYNDTALDDLATWERAQLGLFISFQNPTPIEGLSNFRLIKEAMDMGTTSSIMDKLNGFRALAKELNLPEGWDKKELNVEASGGEKKKNELIQMKMLDPAVAILDEPDSGLDVDAINSLIEQLQDFNSKDKTIIIVSHYEKLLKSFEPTTVTVVANGTTSQTTDASVVDKVLSDGFKDFV
jgi:Fe-S cluster assembly ATP-binding protein